MRFLNVFLITIFHLINTSLYIHFWAVVFLAVAFCTFFRSIRELARGGK